MLRVRIFGTPSVSVLLKAVSLKAVSLKAVSLTAVFLTAVLMTAAAALAYPIPPNPLWNLTSEASLIVVAEVVGSEARKPTENDWNSSMARLQVIQTLKGPKLATVQVPYPAGLTCPAPPRYAMGETVVAFLEFHDKQWQTVSLSYGTLYPNGPDLKDMITIIRSALVIQRSGGTSKWLNQRKHEWLVEAAALPGTRWHGLYELGPASDAIRSFDNPAEQRSIRLQKPNLARLAKAFVEAPKFDATMAMMLRTLQGHADPAMDQLALGTLEAMLALDQPQWWIRDLVWAVLARWGEADSGFRLEEFGVNSWDVTAEQLRRIWFVAKRQLGIPEVEPISIELEEYSPVGGQTPSR